MTPHAARPILLLTLAITSLAARSARADEGKWTPEQVLELDARKLRARGLTLPTSRLWDPKRGTGLLAGAVRVSGCSGAFVSREGLVVTNHHCIYSLLQEHSAPARDLITHGFLARTRGEELPGKGARIQVPRRFLDVTERVLAAVPSAADDLARFTAIETRQKELVLECEKKPATRCSVATFNGGLEYTLIETMELQDIRLVYGPPIGIGGFGGEVDNWSWPRHTGDFGIVRAYVSKEGEPVPYSPDNVPYRPEFYFPLSPDGVRPGDFVMVLGYPSFTVRELLAAEMEHRANHHFPRVLDSFGEMLSILEEVTDPGGKIAVASLHKSHGNRRKNAEGQLAGLARGRILEKQRVAEEAVVRFAGAAPEHRGALDARAELLRELELAAKTFEREHLLELIPRSARALYLATTIARLSTEREKPDLARDPQFMERELPRLRDLLEREQKNLFIPADRRLFTAWLRRARALGPEERIAAVDRWLAARGEDGAAAQTHLEAKGTAAKAGGLAPSRPAPSGIDARSAELEERVAALYAGTKLLDAERRAAMFGAKPAELRALRDPLLELGFELAMELDASKRLQDRRAGASARLRPLWRKAVLAHAAGPVAPDANGTLRVSFASVRGYVPRDGVVYTPQTTLHGLLAKHTGVDPFLVPDRVRAAAEAGGHGRWVDPKLGDVPLCFLSDADTTGGNSGSPVIDGRGRLVGVNFDRVWENVANDFGYNPDIARNISADVRYVLWMLDRVEGATALLEELGATKGSVTAPRGSGSGR